MMNTVLEKIKRHRLVPVVVLKKIEDTLPTLKALCEGDLPVAEVTFRTECAADAIELAVKEFPDMLIGAGTVINAEQCRQAVKAGARFIVSPGLSAEVASVCKESRVLYIPGIITPTEIVQAIALGLTVLKFFPSESFGGLKTIKSLSAAFPQVLFMPTGGIDERNLHEYLSFNKIIACGGSFMMKESPEQIIKTLRDVWAELKS